MVVSMKKCKTCKVSKPLGIESFRHRLNHDKSKMYISSTCKPCDRLASRENQRENPERAKKNNSNFLNKNPNYKKQWKAKNKKQQTLYRREYESQTHIRLKKTISAAIWKALKNKETSKTSSTLSFLPYSIDKLKTHIESQFEPWMSWDNWGMYELDTWDDNDSRTWTWQIDHKKPMARHVYSCQEDSEFLKAWELSNLRPLKSKENIILGAKMKRIKTINEVK